MALDPELQQTLDRWMSQEVEARFPGGYTMFTLGAPSRDAFVGFVDELPFLKLEGDALSTMDHVAFLVFRGADGSHMVFIAGDFAVPEIGLVLLRGDGHGLEPIAHAVGTGVPRLREAQTAAGYSGLAIHPPATESSKPAEPAAPAEPPGPAERPGSSEPGKSWWQLWK
jgi:hypothetical protein